jgi:plasmid replication initiation protein
MDEKLTNSLTETEVKYKVFKHNDLIQMTRNTMSLNGKKIIAYLISKIQKDDEDFLEQKLEVVKLIELIGLNGTSGANYQIIKDSIKNIAEPCVWWTLPNGKETLVRWIDKPLIDKGSGLIEIKLDSDLKPYLLDLHKKGFFTAYLLEDVLNLKSNYAFNLYELLKSYENKKEITIDLDDLKLRLNAGNYNKYANFRQKVLDVATAEINEKTDLLISWKPIKGAYSGRKVTEIEFIINRKEEKKKPKLMPKSKLAKTIQEKSHNEKLKEKIANGEINW